MSYKRLIPCIFIYKGKAIKWFDDKEVVSDDVIGLAKQYCDKGALELKRLKSRKQKDDLVTIWNVAKKHNAGIEMVKRWYQWNGVKVDEDYLQQCIDLIEKYNVQSLDQFAELMSRQ